MNDEEKRNYLFQHLQLLQNVLIQLRNTTVLSGIINHLV